MHELPALPEGDRPQGFVEAAKVSRGAQDPAPLPLLIYWKKDLSVMLGVKVRSLERMISAGEIPPPDMRLRGRPAWLVGTIHQWVADRCPKSIPKSRDDYQNFRLLMLRGAGRQLWS